MQGFKPFADGEASAGVSGLTLENGAERIALYGTLDLGRDKQGLAAARALMALFADIVRVLEADPALPDALAPPPAPAPATMASDDSVALPKGGLT